MTKPSTDYHDYVFRDGRLVGEFDAMYRHSAEIPWHQDAQADAIDVRLTVELLKGCGPFDELHDIGCGLGYYLALMHQHVGGAGCRAFGYDVSATACAMARARFPDFAFQALDIMRAPLHGSPGRLRQPDSRGLFMMRALVWYVYPRLREVVKTVREAMTERDALLVVQNFPPLGGPFVGKDVIPDHHALIRHLAPAFVLERHLWFEDRRLAVNDQWFIGVFSPGAAE